MHTHDTHVFCEYVASVKKHMYLKAAVLFYVMMITLSVHM